MRTLSIPSFSIQGQRGVSGGRRAWPPLPGLLGGALFALVVGMTGRAQAAKVVGVQALDRDYLAVHVLDGEVLHETPDEAASPSTRKVATMVCRESTLARLRTSTSTTGTPA
jgi:hypothetical protein